MPRWGEVKARWPWLLEHLSDDEPVLFKLPRREARKRIENKEKRHRIVMNVDETTYSEFAVWREAYMSKLDENPVLFGYALIQAMKEFDLLAWKQEQAESDFVMGKDLHHAE
jgi:hypothetical protein